MITNSLFFKPKRIVEPTGWVGHIPLAFWIIEVVKPSVFVELGTHSGNSYFAFCQSVLSNLLPTKCYAVDTWEGDEHAGFYDNSVYTEVVSYNKSQYDIFSRLLRMTFDNALSFFSDHSIDLLHIDGLHTYEAVKHDFESWLPKLSHCGVVLFHDINVKDRNFGVWKFWEEISTQYPHIAFDHSSGLGVLIVGTEQNPAITKIINEFQSPSGTTLNLTNADLNALADGFTQVIIGRVSGGHAESHASSVRRQRGALSTGRRRERQKAITISSSIPDLNSRSSITS